MNYISIKEAAVLWGMDKSNIGKLCRKGKIEGAKIVAGSWFIPKQTPKPIDGRTKKAKSKERVFSFRFPLFVNNEEEDFVPSLSPEEATLRRAQKDYYACDFETAKTGFKNVLYQTKSIYIKITALYYLCSLSVEVYSGLNFKLYYRELQIALAGDFPNKTEMEIITPWLYASLAQFLSVSQSFNLNPFYDYSPTVLPLLSHLSFYRIAEDLQAMTSRTYCDSYELLCRQIEQSGAFYEACESHLTLFCAYYLTLNENAMLYHLKNALDISMKHNMPLLPASYLSYYPDAFDKIAKDYPEEYIEKIKYNSNILSKSFSEYTEKYEITKIYSRLSSKDYRYMLFAFNGCTNKEVAEIMNISERTVTNRYTEIFNKLGVFGKKQLLELTDYKFKE